MGMMAQLRLHQPEIYFGVHAGVLASTVDFKPTVPNMSPLTQACTLSPNGGLVFRYSGHKCCAVQVEVNYMQRGWREHSDSTNYTRRLDFIEIPFLTHIYFGSQSCRGFVNIGPQLGINIYDNGGVGDRQTKATHQYLSIDNMVEWGVAGGLGVYYRSKKAGLYQLEARFNYSFGTLFASGTTDYFSSSNSMNLSLNLAWMWEFKKNNKRKIKPIKNNTYYENKL